MKSQKKISPFPPWLIPLPVGERRCIKEVVCFFSVALILRSTRVSRMLLSLLVCRLIWLSLLACSLVAEFWVRQDNTLSLTASVIM